LLATAYRYGRAAIDPQFSFSKVTNVSSPEAAEKKPEKKAEAANTTAETSALTNPFDKHVNILNPEQNKQYAEAKMIQEVQTATQKPKSGSGYSDTEFKSIADNLKGTSKLSLALDNAYANECINAQACKDKNVGKTRSYDEFRAFLESGAKSEKSDAKPASAKSKEDAAKEEAEKAEALKNLRAVTGGKVQDVKEAKNVSDSVMQETTVKQRTDLELKQDNQKIREQTNGADKIFSTMNDDLLKKHPEWKISREGEAIVRRDAQGNEVFRQQGDVTTLTVDGKKYVSDASRGTKEVFGEDGKLELRRYSNNVVDIPGDNGSALRYNLNNNSVYIVDGNNQIISDTVNEKGEVITEMEDSRVIAMPGKLDFNNPDKIYQDLLALGKDKNGIVTYENGIAMVKRGEDGKLQILVVGKNGEVIRSRDDGHYFFGKDRRWVERSLDGSPERSLTREQWLKLKDECGDDIENLNKFKRTYTLGGDTITVTRDQNNPSAVSIAATLGGITTEVDAEGRRITKTPDGVERITAPGSSDTTIKGKGFDVKLTKGGLQTPKFNIDKGGDIVDRSTGVHINGSTIKTNDGTVYNSDTNKTTFGDGVTIDKYGTVGHASYDANIAFNRKTEAAGQEAKALSAVANAQSMAAEILSKASSGRVTSSDIAALSATLGGLEASIKMLASEVDPSAMLRVMMTKGMVSESLGQAQSLAGKNQLSGNRNMAA